MGWPWDDPKPSPQQISSKDPLRDLDPTLRAFLTTSTPSSAPPTPPAPSSSEITEPTPVVTPSTSSAGVPPQSLYPDGRFADLWSTYRPLHEIQSEHQTDQEKLLEVLEGYKERKAEIGRIALENCAMEQSAVDECFRGGGWAKRMWMCSEEQRGFERCFLMQSRFLKALGYLSTRDRDPAIDEQIQMHADTLYHRMLSQERAIRDAESAGLPLPQFPPILSSSSSSSSPSASASASTAASDLLSSAARKSLEERLKDMPREEAEVEERATVMEAKQDENVGREIGGLWQERARERRERRERGETTVGDWFSGLFGR